MLTFYRENTVWPYVHSLMNAAVYIAIRNPWIAIGLMLFFELFEWAVLSRIWVSFKERIDDTLIGDPLIGITIILSFYFIDLRTGWDAEFVRAVPFYIRLLQALTIGVIATFAAHSDPESRVIVALIGTAYVVVALAYYLPFVLRSDAGSGAWRTVALWLYFAVLLTLFVAPRFPTDAFPFNTFMRVLFVNVTLLATAALLLIMGLLSNDTAKRR